MKRLQTRLWLEEEERSTVSAHSLVSPFTAVSFDRARADVGRKRRSFRLPGKNVAAQEGRRFSFFNKIWPPCELNVCKCIATAEVHPAWRLGGLGGGGAASPSSGSHYRLNTGSLHGAIGPPDGKFIIDSDLSPSLLTSKLVLACM